MILFKDISYAQGAYNMDADPDQAVAMKASGFYTGSKLPYLDDQLVRNYADAIRLGKVPIMYHFAGGGDPATEAAYFIAAVHPLADGDLYALDWEIPHPDPVGWVNTFVTKVHDATGVWPWVYMNMSTANAYDWSPVFKNCGYWCAAPSFGFNDTLPVKYPQIAQQGPIVGGVDTDAFFGTLDQLKKYGYHSAPAPAPIPTPVPPPPAPTPVIDPKPPAPVPEPTPVPPAPEPTPTPVPVVPAPILPATDWKKLVGTIATAILAAIAAIALWLKK